MMQKKNKRRKFSFYFLTNQNRPIITQHDNFRLLRRIDNIASQLNALSFHKNVLIMLYLSAKQYFKKINNDEMV